MRRILVSAFLAALTAAPLHAQSCGGSFSAFVEGLKAEALSQGQPRDVVDSFFQGVQHNQTVLNRDRQQGIFGRPFTEFSRNLISQGRIDRGRQIAQRQSALFEAMERNYGVSRGIMLAFLAFETDYGQVQGDFNTRDALVTLAHDCRRPQLFRPQIFAMMELYRQGALDPRRTQGAWAGEIGMVQMLPADILRLGVDGDGDGRVDLRGSLADAVLSGAALLRSHGWQAGQPWLQEVRISQATDLTRSGLRHELTPAEWERMGVTPRSGSFPAGNTRASLILPQGHRGPAFLAYPNMRVLFEWNQSFTYVLTAAYFANRLEGAPVFEAGNPETGLNQEQMIELQNRLQGRGFNVGAVDGILGANTRNAVQDVQAQLGLPADGWPTPELLRRLR